MNEHATLPELAVEAPLLPAPENAPMDTNPFQSGLKDDPTIKRFGKFHLGPRTVWWSVSKTGFGSEGESVDSGRMVTRRIFLEFSQVREGLNTLHRLVIGRLLISVA